MGAFIHNDSSTRCAAALLASLLLARPAAAADPDEGGLTYKADRIISQLRTDTMELVGNVNLTQGTRSISAARARVQAPDSNNAQWLFQDSVQVLTVEAELRAERVSATIAQGTLAAARVEGSPAEFRQLNGPPDARGRGRAHVIEYDIEDGVVKFTGDAEPVWFLYGKDQNELRTDVLTYNMRTGTLSTGRTQGRIPLNNRSGTRSDPVPDAPQKSSESPSGARQDGA